MSEASSVGASCHWQWCCQAHTQGIPKHASHGTESSKCEWRCRWVPDQWVHWEHGCIGRLHDWLPWATVMCRQPRASASHRIGTMVHCHAWLDEGCDLGSIDPDATCQEATDEAHDHGTQECPQVMERQCWVDSKAPNWWIRDKAHIGFMLLAVRASVMACRPMFALATPLECSSIRNLALRLAWCRSNILPVLIVTLVLTTLSIDIATSCTAIAASTATIVTTVVAVVYIGIHLALVGTFSCPVSRFATSVAISGLGASWLSAHLGLKQGIDLSASVCPIGRSDGLEGGRRSIWIMTNVSSWWPLAAISLLMVGILSDLTDGLVGQVLLCHVFLCFIVTHMAHNFELLLEFLLLDA